MAKMLQREKPTKVQGANPYNAQKDWSDEGVTGEEFVSADSMYVPKKKTAMIDNNPKPQNEEEDVAKPRSSDVSTEELQQEPEQRYQKVDWKKRHDDLKRHHDRKLNEMKDQIAALEQQMRENRPKYQPPKTAEDLEKFKEENPDLFGVVETVAHMRSTQEMEDLKKELEDLKTKAQYEAARAAYAELKSMVPDYEEIRQSKEFYDWADQQPQQIQDWIYKNATDATLAAKAINLYKADTGKLGAVAQRRTNPKPEPQSAGAEQAVPTSRRREEPSGGEKIWTRAEIASLSWKQYDSVKDEIDRAFAEGRVQ